MKKHVGISFRRYRNDGTLDSAATVNVYFASRLEWDKSYAAGEYTCDNVSIGTDPATEESYLPLFLPVVGGTTIKYNGIIEPGRFRLSG